jgi:hypothetical protein
LEVNDGGMSDALILSAIAALRTDMTSRMDGFEANQTTLRADLTERMYDLASRMDALETGQATFRADLVAEFGKTRGAIMEKVAEVQTSITAIRDDIAVNFGAVDQARRINDNTRDEMRGLNDLVARMMTLILRLQTEVAELKGKPAP